MVDIHSHILPGVDDGAESLEEALRMAEAAAQSGVNHIAATSHGNFYAYSLQEYWDTFHTLQDNLRQNGIPVKLYPGMEIYLDDTAFEGLEKKELLSMNQTDYLLVEFPFEEETEVVSRRIMRLINEGWRIVLAHPERYRFIHREVEFAYYLAELGCVLQVNQGSVLGDFGSMPRKIAHRLLRDGAANVIATDAHDALMRTASIREGLSYLKQEFSQEQIRLWLSENPSRILKGYDIIKLI